MAVSALVNGTSTMVSTTDDQSSMLPSSVGGVDTGRHLIDSTAVHDGCCIADAWFDVMEDAPTTMIERSLLLQSMMIEFI